MATAGVRLALIIMLNLCLLLTVARQLCDFIGRLWLAILVNFVHILFLIFGLFGVVQYRLKFLTLLAVWTPFIIAWNVFIILFYLNIAIFNRNDPILGLGFDSRVSHSFWTRHNPLCKSGYNFTLSAWVSDEHCLVKYYYVEAAQAVFHILLLLICFYLTIRFLIQCRTKQHSVDGSDGSLTRRQPTVTLEFPAQQANGSGQPPNVAIANANVGYQSDSCEISSGYMNTSFESGPSARNGFAPSLNPNGVLVQSYQQRRSKKRKKRDQRPAPAASIDNVSVSSARDMHRQQQKLTAQPPVLHGRTKSQSRSEREVRRRSRARSQSPIRPSHSHQSHAAYQNLAPPQPPVAPEEPPYVRGRPRSSSLKYRPFKHDLVGGLPSKIHASNSENHLLSRSKGSTPSLHNYPAEPKRLSVAEVRALHNSNDSILNASPSKNKKAPMTAAEASLVSFDPKSNTLLRYSHLGRSEETIPSADSSFSNLPPPPPDLMSPPTLLAPMPLKMPQRTEYPPPPDRISYDSGVPTSLSNGPGSESALSDHHIKQYDLPSDINRQQIYEPLYAPRFLRAPPQQSGDYHSHYQNFLRAYKSGSSDEDLLTEPRASLRDYHQQQRRPEPHPMPVVANGSLLV